MLRAYVGALISTLSRQSVVQADADNVAPPELLDNHMVERKYASNTWERQAYDVFAVKMSAKANIFPCLYGSKGYKDNNLLYLFLPSDNVAKKEVADICARAIRAYNRGTNRTVDGYQKLFWALLKELRKLDSEPWPKEITENTDSEYWRFCFDNQSAFWAVFTSAHIQRHSRHLPNFCLIYQPSWTLDRLLNTDAKRKSITEKIRGLVDEYDHPLICSPDVSNYGELGTTESREYYLLDENKTAICPYPTL
ncbi:hypothetical protein MMC22_008962 [Lobaria immixta]|nr:hypothetical protein [Lobaria immixta]